MTTELRQISPPLTVGQCFTLATIMEATVPKPGNIHRGADFEDASYPDFIIAASMVGPMFDALPQIPLGELILRAVVRTREMVNTNTNLGTLLLLGPLAKVPRTSTLHEGVGQVLDLLSPQDARDVYEAIRFAQPGGLGKVADADIADEPPADLRAAMRSAAERDMVARQWANQFQEVFEVVVPRLEAALAVGPDLPAAIVHLHVELMARFPDSLIARRCGPEIAAQSAARAQKVLDSGKPGDDAYDRGLSDLDYWLRTDGHRRNPGTTADLVAAGLFVALRDGIIKPPFRLARL
jgi:triphosphoribosyl-dephospho-CoA synthase